jgi:hypothetical protein
MVEQFLPTALKAAAIVLLVGAAIASACLAWAAMHTTGEPRLSHWA